MSDEVLTEAKEAFEDSADAESDNRNLARENLNFARLGEQWPHNVLQIRERQGRPTLTVNKMPAYIRQVTNDARQNKPQIKVRPVDSNADPETAQVINGLIRNIEHQSNADTAYDTASDFAVTMGFGYFGIDVDYSFDDSFEQDIRIETIPNPFNVYGDPYSRAPDSSDWNSAFLVEAIPHKVFERQYKGAEKVDWDSEGYGVLDQPWFDSEQVLVAKWWKREEIDKEIALLSNGDVVGVKEFEGLDWLYEPQGIAIQNTRVVKSHKVKHYLLTGAEVLEETDWPGRYIPLVPVYGEDINIEGKRYLLSLIHHAKDAQRMHNYWRSTTTELVALAPKAPFIGPEDAFTGQDARKWETANVDNHAFLGFAGQIAPKREPFAGVPAGALQEALNANDDMKSIIGLYDASLGARSNETSGRAIMARQREGDVSTFHFQDNLSRSIRHGGRIVLDLIPHVYTGPRIIRVLGWDGATEDAQIGPESQRPDEEMPDITPIYNLTVGKYDLTVEAGPSFTTQRQEAAEQMIELIRSFPQAAPVIGDLLAKNLDWPGADEIAERLQKLLPDQGADPRIMQMAQQLQQLQAALVEAQAKLKDKSGEQEIDLMKVVNDAYDAETKRIKALADADKAMTESASPAGPYDRYQ